ALMASTRGRKARMRRSFEEPNSLRATAPIIASSSFQFGPRSASPTSGKCSAIYGFCKAIAARQDTLRDIGGGRFVVNVSCYFTASLNTRTIQPLPRRTDSASVRVGNVRPRLVSRFRSSYHVRHSRLRTSESKGHQQIIVLVWLLVQKSA